MRELTVKEFAELQGCAESTARKRLKAMGARAVERTKKIAVCSAYERHTVNSRYFVYLIPEEQIDACQPDPGQQS